FGTSPATPLDEQDEPIIGIPPHRSTVFLKEFVLWRGRGTAARDAGCSVGFMEDTAMRILLCGAAALALLTLPAAAQDNVKSGNTLDPIALSKQAQQPAAIRDGLVAVHTQQKAPQGFQPKPGDKLPKALKVEGLPQDVVRKDPA